MLGVPMRFCGRTGVTGAALLVGLIFALIPQNVVAIELATGPTPAASSAPTASLPLIGHVRAVTPFCKQIVDQASALADNQLADILTATEALRILAYAPFDRDSFTERRGTRALEMLSSRLMASRRGDAQVFVAGLRKAALGGPGEAPRPDLATFAGALDGAHSQSSEIAHEISRALAVLDADGIQFGIYMPDFTLFDDPRFVRARAGVPFPIDATFESFSPAQVVQNGPLHRYARSMAYQVAESLERLLISVDDARKIFPTAFAGCLQDDAPPTPAQSTTP
jgi:hypothetical protein